MRMCSLLSKTKQSYWYNDVEEMHVATRNYERTTSSAMTRRLNSTARAAIFSSSSRVKTFPTGLWGVLTIIILVRGVMAALQGHVQDNITRNEREVDRSSSKSMVQSLLVGFGMSCEGGCKGIYTGFPPLNVTDGKY